MLKNYLKTAWRNILRNRTISLINVVGLAFGIASGILILLWIAQEYQVDSFHKNGRRLYSVYVKQFSSEGVNAYYGGSGNLASEMKRVLPEVELAVNMDWSGLHSFEANNKIIKQKGLHAGADFFEMFSFPLLEGTAGAALQNPEDIAISQKMAESIYGSAGKAIGETILYENTKYFKIAAVFENLPEASSMQFDYLINYHQIASLDWVNDWGNSGQPCHLLLREGTDEKAFEAKISTFLDAYDKEQSTYSYKRLGIQNYADVYLHSNFDGNGNVAGGRILYIQIFSIVAVFILLIACINFVNLSTAKSVSRAKEIGIRKVIGALRMALVRQFIIESLLIVILAVIISFGILLMVLPRFSQLIGKEVTLPVDSPGFWLSFLLLFTLTVLTAGSYPAFYLSSYKPVKALKGLARISGEAIWFRKGLVVFQFMLSIILIVGTVVINRQVRYMQTENLGYNKENLLFVPLEGEILRKYDLAKSQLLNMPGIKDISRTTDKFIDIRNGTTGVQWPGKISNKEIDFAHAAVGRDFVKTLQLQLVEGRDFSKEFATDSMAYLLNESAAKIMGFKNPVGQQITLWGNQGTIIGVIKDFHFNSLNQEIRPLILRYGENADYGNAIVRTEAGMTQEALGSLEKALKQLNPKFPFTFQFSDQEYAKLYQSEQLTSSLVNYFAFLGILISCLGLFGLVMFTAHQRTKEMGVRKVLGASVPNLFQLILKDFVFLVIIACSIAMPIAYYFTDSWLKRYSYHIDLSWSIFVMAGFGVVGITVLTVSYQALKAALVNPVKSLRSE